MYFFGQKMLRLGFFLTTLLTGTISMSMNDGTQMSVDVDLNDPEAEVRLFADCLNDVISKELPNHKLPRKRPFFQQNYMLSHPISWTEALGLNQDIPIREPIMEAGKWRRINRNCEDDQQFPGLRYENPTDPSLYGLVLIYDSAEMLIGVQIAVPRALVEDNGFYDYENSPYYIEGLYDRELAFFITLYMDDREEVCRPKAASQLLCDPSLGQEAFVISKTSEIRIFKHQRDAMVSRF